MHASQFTCWTALAMLVACGEPDAEPVETGRAVDTAVIEEPKPVGPPVELTDDLCDDPSNIQPILEALNSASGDAEGPSYGDVNLEQVQRMLQNPTEGPIYFVNLIKFRDRAVYADGRETDLTGRQANDLYSPIPFITAIGGRVVYSGSVSDVVEGDDAWEEIGIVEYPCPLANFAMSLHPDFQETSIHKDAGLEKSTILVADLRFTGEVEPSMSSFDRMQVIRRADTDALEAHESELAGLQAQVGIEPIARLDVQGAYISDGQTWDEVWIDRVPNAEALDALAIELENLTATRDAAVDGAYSLNVAPLIDNFPMVGRDVAFEILEVLGQDEIRVWFSSDISLAEFDAIELPGGWFKNQPREGEADGGSFARSPGATEDGPLIEGEHFGHRWRHNATIIESNIPLDDDGLLRLNRIEKFHEIRFAAGRTLKVLVSPEQEAYVRVSRDAGRLSDAPTLPEGWQLLDYAITSEWVVQLPNPTLNIRGDNEDSFQGPVTLDQGL
ncbi:MAG: hypothetical protein AAGA48_03375 [Myxococcota bacterium]